MFRILQIKIQFRHIGGKIVERNTQRHERVKKIEQSIAHMANNVDGKIVEAVQPLHDGLEKQNEEHTRRTEALEKTLTTTLLDQCGNATSRRIRMCSIWLRRREEAVITEVDDSIEARMWGVERRLPTQLARWCGIIDPYNSASRHVGPQVLKARQTTSTNPTRMEKHKTRWQYTVMTRCAFKCHSFTADQLLQVAGRMLCMQYGKDQRKLQEDMAECVTKTVITRWHSIQLSLQAYWMRVLTFRRCTFHYHFTAWNRNLLYAQNTPGGSCWTRCAWCWSLALLLAAHVIRVVRPAAATWVNSSPNRIHSRPVSWEAKVHPRTSYLRPLPLDGDFFFVSGAHKQCPLRAKIGSTKITKCCCICPEHMMSFACKRFLALLLKGKTRRWTGRELYSILMAWFLLWETTDLSDRLDPLNFRILRVQCIYLVAPGSFEDAAGYHCSKVAFVFEVSNA